jgi:flagellar biogenesis protein FliO
MEDAFVIGLGLLALKYPVAAFVVTLLIVLTIVWMARWIVRRLRGLGRPVPAA